MKILISDPTLRDGNHAIKHQLSLEHIKAYCRAAEQAHVPIIEVGHGNGLGASSLQVGKANFTDNQMLSTARQELIHSKLCVHVIPGFATIKRDIQPAIDSGVDIFRCASHCTESDTTQRHIEYILDKGKECYGVLMMSHMQPKNKLLEEACKLQTYGATAVILMDSAGAYLPFDVEQKVSYLSKYLDISIGFHAHNNLGLAIANSIQAINSGATIIDATICGFGAGAGNAQLEALIAVLNKLNIETGIDLYKILDAADIARASFIKQAPFSSSLNIISGMAGVFSGFTKHVQSAAHDFQVDPRDIFFELGKQKVIAGQEDIIFSITEKLAKQITN